MTVENVSIIIPSSPADRKALADGIKEMSDSMARITGEQTYIKESIDALKEKFGVDGKWIRKMLTDFHKDQFDKVSEEAVQYGDLYEAILLTSNDVDVPAGDEVPTQYSELGEV